MDKEVHIKLFLSIIPCSHVLLQVRLMCGSKWGMGRVLFCISRYLSFVASVIYHYCASIRLFGTSSALTYDLCRSVRSRIRPVRLCPFVLCFRCTQLIWGI